MEFDSAESRQYRSDNEAAPAANGVNGHSEEDSDDELQIQKFDFEDLTARIEEVVAEYGAVFPKLSWSSPQVSRNISYPSVLR